MSEPEVRGSELIEAVDGKITAVRTQSLDFSFNELADMYEENELIIDPEFQRMFRWTEGAQSRFIESLILELPIPPIFLVERDDRIYELIDGLQRFSSYLHFRGRLIEDGVRRDPLTLVDCDIAEELNGNTASSLPRALDIKLKRSYVRAEILRKESDARLRYYMFKRLNTGGEQLSEQEIRNATIRLLNNEFNQFIIDRSRDQNFAYCVDILTENQVKRKFDQELVLRFFAFKNDRDRYRHDLADFLTDYMEAVSDPEDPKEFDYPIEQRVFAKTFDILRRAASATEGVETRVFGSVNARTGEPRTQFSVYHFESIAIGLQAVLDEVDPENAAQVDEIGKAIRIGKSDPIFLSYLGGGKNDLVPLRQRIAYFENSFRTALK